MHHERDTKQIQLEQDVLGENDRIAAENRHMFSHAGVFVLNVMSSPGSGKTTLLTRTIEALNDKMKLAVVVGDICTTNDAERLQKGGDVPVVQICTEPFGGDCHLNAELIRDAVSGIDVESLDLLIVENLGNLVCPAEFDVGEDKRAVILSVTEGEDKPLKYPLMFQVCDVTLLNKIDLLPHLDYDKDFAIKCIRDVHPNMPVFETSARTGEGMEKWLEWIVNEFGAKKAGN